MKGRRLLLGLGAAVGAAALASTLRPSVSREAAPAAPPRNQRAANVGASGKRGRGPGPRPPRSATAASPTAIRTNSRSWRWSPAVRSRRCAHRAAIVSPARATS